MVLVQMFKLCGEAHGNGRCQAGGSAVAVVQVRRLGRVAVFDCAEGSFVDVSDHWNISVLMT